MKRGLGFCKLLVVVAFAGIVGCSGKPWVNPPPEQVEHSWQNRQPSTDTNPDPDATTIAGLSGALAARPKQAINSRPLNVLVLSGGGKYGAFTAGMLGGWTTSGTRPTFDVATGISSGALTAVLAFLGPKYDGRLISAYINVTRSDLFKIQPIRGLVLGNGVASAEPLERLIERELDAEAMADLRAAHCEGRRVYVATGNATTLRLAIWDLGGIATSGRPDADQLVRKVLLAACSIPGWVPPVEFDVQVNGQHYKELHGDAGNIVQAFIRTANGLTPGSNVYVMTAGKLHRDPLTEKPRIAKGLGATVSNSLYAIFRADLMNLYSHCAVTGSRFHLVALPQDFQGDPGSLTFNEDELYRLYTVGHQMSVNGISWRLTPPGTQPGETIVPRTGLEFVIP